MKRIFLDANILLDVILKREPHAEFSGRFFSLKNSLICTSSLNIANIYFLIQKDFDNQVARKNTGIILEHCEVLEVDSAIIRQAHHSLFDKFVDFEDSIQHFCAVTHSMNCIITRNEKHFRNSELPVYSPQQYFNAF
jgi:predicted nucleic acid-binding protein